ncbi:MAG: tetratricopeptide repeat protein [Nitrospirota bacterium]
MFLSSCATTESRKDIIKAETHSKLGHAYMNKGQLNDAFVEFHKSIRLNPENKRSLNFLGYISTKFKNYDDAVSYYKRAIAIDPDYSDAINNLGVAYAEIKNWDEAIKQFKSALGNPLYKTPERAYSNLGYAYYQKGAYTDAEEALEEALLRNPVLPRAFYILGLIYVKFHENESAIKEFIKAIGIMPYYMEAHWELANAYLRSGENEKALAHFNVVAEQDNNLDRSREALEYLELLK